MAIIYSYPTVNPERTDLILGTDVSSSNKATKNFTIQSVIDLVTVATGDLQTVLDLGNVATGRDINLTNNAFRGGNFVTTGGVSITGTTATGFTNVNSTAFTGTIATPVQPNITSLGSLTALVLDGPISGTGLINNSSLTGAANDNVVSTLAIKTYVDTKVGLYDTLQEVLANGNTTSGSDIVVSAGDDITFTDTSKVILGTGSDATIEHDGTDLKIVNTEGKTTISNSSGDIDISATATAKKLILNGKAGVDLNFEGSKKIETLVGGAKVTGAFEATTSGTFASLINTGSYSDSSGDIGTAGQILSSTGSGTNWVTELPLYTWSLEGTAIPSGTAVTVTDGTNITTTWDAANFDLTIATTGVPDGSGAANQVTYWSDTDTLTGAAGFTFAGGATGKVAIAGELEVGGVLTDGTFTGSAGIYTGYTSITSTDFAGALTGNASTATALASSGAIAISGDAVSTGGPHTYTSGGAVTIPTTIADTTVTGKVLTNLPTPTSAAIAASDTILAAMAKLQGQITGIPQGLVYKGTWNASTNTPTLASGTGVTGEFYIVSVAGATNLDGITDWQVGDWAVFVEVGATDTWQKIDNTSAILGSGTANKIAKWTGSNTLATGLIADDGTTVTVGNSGNFIVEGNTTLGDADTDSTTVKGPAVFEETLRINEGISLGAATYGSAGQVLTSGGGAASVNTWTTPTTGTVTSVTAGTGITIGGTAADPTVAIDYLGTDNAILSAPQENGIATTDTVWFSDATDDNIKKTTVANLIALDGARSLSATLAIGNTSGANNIIMADNQSINLGTNSDLVIDYNSAGNFGRISNTSGHLYIQNSADNSDIIFRSDDSSGGLAEYFKVDGSLLQTVFSKPTRHVDGMAASFGNSYDLNIYHTGTDSFIDNNTGNLNFRSFATDKDIIFQSDDGSGGVTEYLRLDGSAEEMYFSKSTLLFDNVKAKFGNGSDLQIYHDGSNSYINDTGTGSLLLKTSSLLVRNPSDASMLDAQSGGAINLYYNGSKTFETTSTGVNIDQPGNTYSRISLKGSGTTYGTVQGDSTNGLLLRSGGNSNQGLAINGYNSTFLGSWGGGVSGTVMKVEGFFPKVEIGDSTNFGNGNLTDLEVWGDVDIKGKLNVGSSGVSSMGGRNFAFVTKSLPNGGAWQDMFSISGVWMPVISELLAQGGVSGSITRNQAMSYNVAQAGGTSSSVANAPVYNKIIDTGVGSAGGFELQFLAFNASQNNHGYKCQARATTGGSITCDISVSFGIPTFGSGSITFTDLT